MAKICECDFITQEKDTDYSITEYDLKAKLGMSIRRNFKTQRYEIFKINTGEIQYSFSDLESAVRMANQLEEDNLIKLEHGGLGCKHR